MNTDNKKVYPSQINTKALACRVPAADYVKFLQEALSQGINLNDWLLTKIYSEKKTINGTDETDKDSYDSFPLYVETETGTGELYFATPDELIDYVDSQNNKIDELIETIQNLKYYIDNNKLSDSTIRMRICNQLLDYGNTLEWDSKADKIAWKSDVLDVFKTIE